MDSCMRLLTSACIILMVFPSLACSKGGGKNDDSMDARVHMSIGNVSVNKLINPKKGDRILAGDLIETGSDGICEIVIGSGTFLRMSKNTVIIYNISSSSNLIQLRKGSLAGLTKKPMFRDYQITTNTLMAGVNEGSYFVNAENPGNTYICICKGRINLQSRGALSGDTITASSHVASRFTLDEKGLPGVDRNPGQLYHTEAVYREMERKLSGREL